MEITQNNYGYDIQLTVKKNDGTPENLSGIDGIKFQVVDADTYRTIVNGDCVIVDAVNGVCKYTVTQNDFTKAGNFKGSLQIRYTPSKRVNTKTFYITVEKQLGPTA